MGPDLPCSWGSQNLSGQQIEPAPKVLRCCLSSRRPLASARSFIKLYLGGAFFALECTAFDVYAFIVYFYVCLTPMNNAQIIGDVSYAARVKMHIWHHMFLSCCIPKGEAIKLFIMLDMLHELNCIIESVCAFAPADY